MTFKKMLKGGVLIFGSVGLLVSAIALVPSRSLAVEAVTVSNGQQDKAEGKKDPHARFRDGSMMEMMGMMSPHGKKSKSPHGKKKGKHAPFSAQGLKEKLGLDDVQTKKMRQLISTYRKESIRKKAALKIAQIEFDEAVAEKGFSLSDVEKKVRERESMASALTMVRVKALAGASEVLSASQFEKFKGLMAHRMSRHKKGKKHGGHGFGVHGRRGKHGFSGGHGFSPHGSAGAHGGMMGHGGFGAHGKSGSFDGAHGGASPHGKMRRSGSDGYDD